MDNQNNQWVEYLKTGKEASKAVKVKQIVDVRKKLKAKYPNIPIPDPNRIVRTVSSKQQRAISQGGER